MDSWCIRRLTGKRIAKGGGVCLIVAARRYCAWNAMGDPMPRVVNATAETVALRALDKPVSCRDCTVNSWHSPRNAVPRDRLDGATTGTEVRGSFVVIDETGIRPHRYASPADAHNPPGASMPPRDDHRLSLLPGRPPSTSRLTTPCRRFAAARHERKGGVSKGITWVERRPATHPGQSSEAVLWFD